MRVTPAAKTDFVEVLKRRIAAKKASPAQEPKEFDPKLAESKSLSDAALAELTARRDRWRDEVDELSSVSGHSLST